MRTNEFRLGLRWKLIFYLLLPSCFVVGILLYLYNKDLNDVLHQRYVEEAILDSKILEITLVSDRMVQDQNLLQVMINDFMVFNPQYLKVNLYDLAGKEPVIRSSSDPEIIGEGVQDLETPVLLRGVPFAHQKVEQGQKVLETVVPFISKGKKPLAIGLYSPMGPKDAIIRHLRSRVLIAGPLGVGLLMFIVYLVINQRVVKPVHRLAEHTRSVAQGDYETKVPVKGTDETAMLAEAFNQMCASINASKEALESLSRQNKLILDSAGEGIYGLDLEGKVTFVNPAAERMLGWESDDLIGKPQHEILHHAKPDGSPYPMEESPMNAALRDGLVHHGDHEVFWRKDGSSFPVEYISKPILENEKPSGAVVTFSDITERKRSEERLTQLASFPELNPEPIIEIDFEGRVHYMNPIAALSVPDVQEIGLQHPFLAGLNPVIVSFQNGDRGTHIREVRVGGYWYEQRLNYVERIDRIRIYSLDITDRKQAQKALEEQAIRDDLTGLYNRRHFNDRINHEIAQSKRNGQSLAILLCDVDGFKGINDTQGHHMGDQVLKSVAGGILEATRGSDLTFRWGGDEFVVILSGCRREGILVAAERIRKGIHKIGDALNQDLDLSIGIAFYPGHADNPEDLIRIADLALYIAKKGGDKVHIGTEEYHLDERSIRIVFQPVVAVQPIVDIQIDQVIGYEALSRDPEGKLSILELFKKYQMIGKLNELKCICFKTQLKAAQNAGLRKIFINVDFGVLTQVDPMPKPAGMDVILEISELEALHDVDRCIEITRQWRDLGFKFAIDDFGAGFVSFTFIARFIPDYIKVDRSTILQAVSSEQFKAFLGGLVTALRSYSTEGIIAEGVETEKELVVVKEMGIHLIQGFLFGRPKELK